MFIPHDAMFYHTERVWLEFVVVAKGLEHHGDNKVKAHSVMHHSSVERSGFGIAPNFLGLRGLVCHVGLGGTAEVLQCYS